MTPSLRAPATALVILLLVGACAGETGSTTTTTPEPSTTSTATPSTISTTSPTAATHDVQTEIDWLITVLNGEELTADEYKARFTEEFRNQVPFDDFLLTLDQHLRPGAPFSVVKRTGEGAVGEATIEASDGTRLRVPAELDDQGRFAGLLFQPAQPPTLDNPPESVADAFRRLGEIGAFRGLTAEVIDGQCVTIESVNAGEPAPLGSVFKLYVLAALGEAIESGEISWEDEIVIREELKSLPSGVVQGREAGDTVTVREAAELMISVSDNTAADHLIDLLGRERVQAVMADYGNTTPGLNTSPFSTPGSSSL